MNINCNMAADLLPLYHDDICSEKSRVLVEEHLKTCESCRAKLADIEKNLNSKAIDNEETKQIIAVKKRKSTIKKIWLAVAIILASLTVISVTVGGLVFNAMFSTHSYETQSAYEYYIETFPISNQVMPNIDDLPKYEDISYVHTQVNNFFQSNSLLLVVKYDEETYKKEKARLDSYDYLNSPVFYNVDPDPDWYLLPEPEFKIESYSFRVLNAVPRKLENGGNDFDYPKHFGMIAASDKEHSIAYLYYDDADLDYICKSGEINGFNEEAPMMNFVKENFKYEWN